MIEIPTICIFPQVSFIVGGGGAAAGIIPAFFVVCLVLGIIFPVYDYLQARKHARTDELPGLDLLWRNLSESQFLGLFFMMLGAIIFFVGMYYFSSGRWDRMVRVIGGGVAMLGGYALAHMGVLMIRRLEKRIRKATRRKLR